MRIVYFDIDSLRPDHLGCYGYARNTSPVIDEIARDGVCMTDAYCASSPCVPARASLVSGRFGIHHGALTHWGPGSEFRVPKDGGAYRQDMPFLTRYLRQHGYRTVSFSSFADRHHAYWFCAGWTEMHSHSLKGGNETAEEVNAGLIPWLEAHGAEDHVFLHVQYWDPHRNYTIDQSWIDQVRDDPRPAWPDADAIASHQDNAGPFSATELFAYGDGTSPVDTMPDQVTNMEEWGQFVDAYDGSIRYMDAHIGQVVDVLARLDVLEDTAIIISADHGEAMGELGIYGDHVNASEPVHHVPMIVKWPGATGGASVPGLLYNVDFHPTLCDLLGIPVPPGWDGRSFAAAIRGEPWEGRPYLVWDHALYTCQRAVRTPEWLFTRTYHPGLYDLDDKSLFDMSTDPYQTVNVLDDHPDVAADMDATLQDWLHDMIGHHGSAPDPMQEVVRTGPWKYVVPDYWLHRLRNTGRGDDADAICERLGVDDDGCNPFGHPPV